MPKKTKIFFYQLKTALCLLLALQLIITNSAPAIALNDTTKTWTFNASTASDYTYNTTLVTVDNNGASPVSGVNKLSNPAFASNNNSWNVSASPAAYWVEVPGNSSYGTTNFLSMQYEAKYDCTDDDDGDSAATCSAPADSQLGLDYRDITSFNTTNVVSTPNGAPIVHLTHNEAVNACPAGSHLITNNEWMTIARNAEQQTANWADGVIGSLVSSGGGMKRGNVGGTDSVSYNGQNPDYGTSRDSKAMLTLSNGSQIWDISGNFREYVNFDANDNGIYNEAADRLSSQDMPEATDGINTRTGFEWSGFTSADPTGSGWYLANNGSGDFGYDDFRPLDSTLTGLNGVGRVWHDSNSSSTTKIRSFVRGEYYAGLSEAGAFAILMSFNPTSSQSLAVGYRCSTNPVAISQTFSSTSGRSSSGGNTVAVGTASAAKIFQSINVGDTAIYDFSAYLYDTTSGNDGGTVNSSIAQLYYDGVTLPTTYTNVGSGWWKLSGTLTGVNASREYGLLVKTGKTIKIDDFTLSKQGEYSVYNTTAYTNNNVQSWDSFSAADTASGNAAIVYQLCTDDGATCQSGSTWKYWNGSAWATASNTTTHVNTEAELTQTAMQALSITSKKISIKAILNFGGADTPDLDSVTIGLTTDSAAPTISLTPLNPNPTNDTTPSWTGTATESDGTISSIEFQIDSTSGSWTACSANDGGFDEASEAFTCSVTTPLAEGSHTLYVRATDSNNITTSSGSEATDPFTIDQTAPGNIELDSPADNAYTNNERPTFKWKAATGINSYTLEIDNPATGTNNPSGDFSINDIPTSRTTDFETSKYLIRYENFSDSDTNNNYISLHTKSSVDWSNDQNDGKLKEGKVTWRLKTRDSAGNETTSSRTLFVDKTTPQVAITQVNAITRVSTRFSTTDRTPSVFGTITDNLAGGDPSQSQNENGPKIASGPKNLEIKVEKLNGADITLHTLYNVNLNKPWYTCDKTEIQDNTKQKCNKYLPFEYISDKNLDLGIYKLTFTGRDNTDNVSSQTSLIMTITTFADITTHEEKEAIEKEIQKLPPGEQEKAKEQIEITKTQEPTPIEKTVGKVVERTSETGNKIGETVANFIGLIGKGLGNRIQTAASIPGNTLTFLAHTISNSQKGIAATLYGPEKAIADIVTGTRSQIAAISFTVGENTQNVSEQMGFVFIKFGYLFINEPTKIYNVQEIALSPTTAKITWETNHPANGKVNYGYKDGDYDFDVQTGQRTTHHEFILTNLKPNTQYPIPLRSNEPQ